jgi:hypothetical protein
MILIANTVGLCDFEIRSPDQPVYSSFGLLLLIFAFVYFLRYPDLIVGGKQFC